MERNHAENVMLLFVSTNQCLMMLLIIVIDSVARSVERETLKSIAKCFQLATHWTFPGQERPNLRKKDIGCLITINSSYNQHQNHKLQLLLKIFQLLRFPCLEINLNLSGMCVRMF